MLRSNDQTIADPDGQRTQAKARRWLLQVSALVLAGLGLVAISVSLLATANRLPAPPLTGTACINQKLAFLQAAELQTATVIAVGSSATWRNLDMERLERSLPGTRAINAGTCYLHVDQTAFLTDLILKSAPKVTTVITVLAPRDFENCTPRDTAIADPTLIRAYLAGFLPSWALHLVNFRPFYLLTRALDRDSEQNDEMRSDRYGSSHLYYPIAWEPPLAIDDRCFGAVERLERYATASGARLIVATVPTKPAWSAKFDPNGAVVGDWTEKVRARLRHSVFLDGRRLAWPNERFADPVHLLWPAGAEYSDFIASALGPPRHR